MNKQIFTELVQDTNIQYSGEFILIDQINIIHLKTMAYTDGSLKKQTKTHDQRNICIY